jgi:hypothetical protein
MMINVRALGVTVVLLGGAWAASVASHSPPASNLPVFGASDIAAIIEASQRQEPLFNRDYKNRAFSASGLVKEITSDLGGGYMVSVDVRGSTVLCSLDGTRYDLASLALNSRVSITGTIRFTVLGHLSISECNMRA